MCEKISLKSTLKRPRTHCTHEIIAYLGEMLTWTTEKNPSLIEEEKEEEEDKETFAQSQFLHMRDFHVSISRIRRAHYTDALERAMLANIRQGTYGSATYSCTCRRTDKPSSPRFSPLQRGRCFWLRRQRRSTSLLVRWLVTAIGALLIRPCHVI